MTDIALKIRKLRLIRELTQEYLAAQIGISVRTYRAIETGRSSPNLQQLESIAMALQCSLLQFLYFNPDKLQFEKPPDTTPAK